MNKGMNKWMNEVLYLLKNKMNFEIRQIPLIFENFKEK
jgi:hypothetical protein